MAVAVDTAIGTPVAEMATPTDEASAFECAEISALFPSASKPAPPSMPRARASAFTPPSQELFAAIESPLSTAPTLTATAKDVASAVSLPVLETSSLPSPASIAVALDFAVDVETAAATPLVEIETLTSGAVADAVAVISPVLRMVSLPLASSFVSPLSMSPPPPVFNVRVFVVFLSPPSPSIPTAVASAVTPPSHTALPATDTPFSTVTATLAACAFEVAVDVRTPRLVRSSWPSPPRMADDWASAVDCESAADSPFAVSVTASDRAVAEAFASIRPSLKTVSLPVALSVVSVWTIVAPLPLTVSVVFLDVFPEPSASIPSAVASAFVPPSHTESVAAARPSLAMAMFAVSAVTVAADVSAPRFVIVSLPPPPRTAAASASLATLDTTAAMPFLASSATLSDGADAVAVTPIACSLRMVSLPVETVVVFSCSTSTPLPSMAAVISIFSSSPASASIPIAVASDFVPVSHSASAATAWPLPDAATFNPEDSAVDVTSTVPAPRFLMSSLPLPARMPAASASASACEIAAASPSLVTEMFAEPESDRARASMLPVFVITSRPAAPALSLMVS